MIGVRNRSTATVISLALIGAVAPLAVAAMLVFLGAEGASFFATRSFTDLLGSEWRPVDALFGVTPLVTATLTMAVLAGAVSILIGTPAAIRLIYFAPPCERAICEGALTIMAGLPSIIVGLVGLAWLTPVFGFSVISGVLALVVMACPTYTLLVAAALRQKGDALAPTCRALGLTERHMACGPALRAASPSMVVAATLATGKASGEATAISLVIGDVSSRPWPGLFEPASAISTAILKDHGAAAGEHHTALYAAAICLAVIILLINACGALIALYLQKRLIGA